jgi:hypothetical protein
MQKQPIPQVPQQANAKKMSQRIFFGALGLAGATMLVSPALSKPLVEPIPAISSTVADSTAVARDTTKAAQIDSSKARQPADTTKAAQDSPKADEKPDVTLSLNPANNWLSVKGYVYRDGTPANEVDLSVGDELKEIRALGKDIDSWSWNAKKRKISIHFLGVKGALTVREFGGNLLAGTE